MGNGDYNGRSHREVIQQVRTSGLTATAAVERIVKETGQLPALVDPKSKNARRESRNLYTQLPNGKWCLEKGIALPYGSCFDGTSSMDINVQYAYDGGADLRQGLDIGPHALIKGKQLQLLTSVVQDEDDSNPFCISEFEYGDQFVEQQRMLVPNHWGHSRGAQYQMLLLMAGLRIDADIWSYGLKGHLHFVGDEMPWYEDVRPIDVERILGITLESSLSVHEVAEMTTKKWWTIFFQIDNRGGPIPRVTKCWTDLIGREWIVHPGNAQYITAWQTVSIGLVEGVLALTDIKDFLSEVFQEVPKSEVLRIVDGVQGLPLGVQKALPGYDKIPPPGSIFAKEHDIWPENQEEVTVAKTPASAEGTGTTWQL